MNKNHEDQKNRGIVANEAMSTIINTAVLAHIADEPVMVRAREQGYAVVESQAEHGQLIAIDGSGGDRRRGPSPTYHAVVAALEWLEDLFPESVPNPAPPVLQIVDNDNDDDDDLPF
jgi:hypothetical protein